MSTEDQIRKIQKRLKSIEIRLTGNRASLEAQEFDDLSDTPASKAGEAYKTVRVKSDETALVYKNNAINYHCRVYLNSNQLNIVKNSDVKVLMDTVDVNDGSMADIANNKITTVVAGRYRIGLHLTWNITFLNVQYFNMIWINGASTCSIQSPASFAGYARSSQSTITDIAAGIDIEAYCRHEGAANTPDIIAGHHNTFLMVTLLGET